MTDFDPVKAASEELEGLVNVHRVLLTLALDSEKQLAEAETEHNAMVKTEAFVRDLIARHRDRLAQLQREAEAK